MTAYTLFDTPLGRCAIAWSEDGVLGVQLPEKTIAQTRLRLLRHCPEADDAPPTRVIERTIEDIRALFSGEKKTLRAVRLDMGYVAPFNARVYETTRSIPPGQTRTYGEIARAVGKPDAARAVGQALGRNPFPIIVPCHRVIGVDGRLVGFSANGGVITKLKMLEIEGWRANEPSLFDEMA
jgi:methylated-DNA-[protein]-cysteine S-methyltransferase